MRSPNAVSIRTSLKWEFVFLNVYSTQSGTEFCFYNTSWFGRQIFLRNNLYVDFIYFTTECGCLAKIFQKGFSKQLTDKF